MFLGNSLLSALVLGVMALLMSIFLLQRPQLSTETKTQTPKFDLLASNFPPLPGSTAKIPGEPVLESRMSDVVKGVCKEKVPALGSGAHRDTRVLCVERPVSVRATH